MVRYQTSYTVKDVSQRDLGIVDYRGRSVGVEIIIADNVPYEVTDEYACRADALPAPYISVNVHKTKDGRAFGAMQPSQHFSADAPSGEIERYIRKRCLAVVAGTLADNRRRQTK